LWLLGKGGRGFLGNEKKKGGWKDRMMTKVRKLQMDIKKAGPTLDG
jgi:hypothetical protein